MSLIQIKDILVRSENVDSKGERKVVSELIRNVNIKDCFVGDTDTRLVLEKLLTKLKNDYQVMLEGIYQIYLRALHKYLPS
jgi:hypothetical protein